MSDQLVYSQQPDGSWLLVETRLICGKCGGTGGIRVEGCQIFLETCPHCGGRGYSRPILKESQQSDVSRPPEPLGEGADDISAPEGD